MGWARVRIGGQHAWHGQTPLGFGARRLPGAVSPPSLPPPDTRAGTPPPSARSRCGPVCLHVWTGSPRAGSLAGEGAPWPWGPGGLSCWWYWGAGGEHPGTAGDGQQLASGSNLGGGAAAPAPAGGGAVCPGQPPCRSRWSWAQPAGDALFIWLLPSSLTYEFPVLSGDVGIKRWNTIPDDLRRTESRTDRGSTKGVLWTEAFSGRSREGGLPQNPPAPKSPRAGPAQHLQPAGLRPSHAGPPGLPAVPGRQKPHCSRTQGPQRPLLSLGRCYILAESASQKGQGEGVAPALRPGVVLGRGRGGGRYRAALGAPDRLGPHRRAGGTGRIVSPSRGLQRLPGEGPEGSRVARLEWVQAGRPLQGRGAEKLPHPPLPHRGAEPGRMPGPREAGSGTETCPLSMGSAACPD